MVLNNFVVFEGIDGAGTSTQIEMLKHRAGTETFLFTAEPTTAATGLYLRQMLKGEIRVTNETAAYLFAADRNEHINGELCTDGKTLITGVTKACHSGHTVVTDRYFFSSLAYQSISCNPDIPRTVNSFFPLPALLFYFDITPAQSLQRINGRNFREIYEQEEFLNKTVSAYKTILKEYENPAKNQGMKTVIIDATAKKEDISTIIWKEIQNSIKLPIL
ncbi:MAG: dTMP kinase [Treponema sp.]|nr:dTMP kinase [Treponema sp.]